MIVATDGKTSRRSHDRSADKAPLHLVLAFATTSRLVLDQEAVADKTNETTTIPLLIERLAADDGFKATLVLIEAVATNPTIAPTIGRAQADYLWSVKANQPTLRDEIETFFAEAPATSLESTTDMDKGHGRIQQRTVSVARKVDGLNGDRRFPGELRLLDAMARRSRRSGQVSRTQAVKAAEKNPGSMRFMRMLGQRAPGTP